MATTKPSLTDAFDVVSAFHTSILDKLSAEHQRSVEAYAAIMAEFPDEARKGLVYQCAAQMASQINYVGQLDGLRVQYGLDQNPVIVPAA